MVVALIIVSLLALAVFAGAAYLLLERGRLRSDAEVASARLVESERRAEAVAQECADARRALEAAARLERDLTQRLSDAQVEMASIRERAAAAEREHARFVKELAEQRAAMQQAFKDTIDASSAQALKQSSEQFLKLAEKTFAESRERTAASIDAQVKPIAETLRKTDEKLAAIEKSRLEAYTRLESQIRAMMDTGNLLREETGNLVAALRKPQVRGRYGEIQLQRVAELAGMREYCDFNTQTSKRDADGRLLRPDLIVRMPNGRALAIDAKTNIEAYLDAIEASDPDEAQRQLDRFARHVAEQAEALAKKDYWSSIDGCFDFVVMFVPGDQFIDAALERRPQLLDLAAQRGVILASPSTLIGLLRAVYLGWREKSLSDSARELFELGKELHERAATALGYAAEVGKAISRSQELYNRFVGSVDARLMPTLRRFEERGAASARELPQLSAVEGVTREMQSLPSVSTIPLGAPGRHEKAENGSAALRSSDSGVSDQPD